MYIPQNNSYGPPIAKLETIITTPPKPKEAHRAPSATKIKAKKYIPGSRGHPPNSARPLENIPHNSGIEKCKKKFHTKPVTTPPKHNKIQKLNEQDKPITQPPSPPSETSLGDLSWLPTALYPSPEDPELPEPSPESHLNSHLNSCLNFVHQFFIVHLYRTLGTLLMKLEQLKKSLLIYKPARYMGGLAPLV